MQRHVCRDAARGRVGSFKLPPPCVAPQVSLIPFIGKYAIRSFHSNAVHREEYHISSRKIMTRNNFLSLKN